MPGLRLPLGPRRLGPGAAISFLIHVLTIALLVLGGRELLERAPGGLGSRGGGGDVNFFAIPAAAPAAVSSPPMPLPPVTVSDLRALQLVRLDLPKLELPQDHLAPPTIASAAVAAVGQTAGTGAGGGLRAGLGTGAGVDVGPGTGGEGGYIASPRTVISPPLANVPGSVAGRTFRVRFWVADDGRVTRVEVDPPIRDGDYKREFQQRMMAYRFYPATRDGRSVASVVTVSLRIGN
jgi:hypothetical protein